MSGQEWTDLQRYVIEEHFEDYVEGRISRRTLLKRVGYVTGGVSALAALAALGCNVDQPRAGAGGASPSAARASFPPSPQPNTAFATPPAQATTDAVTVKENDPRITQAGSIAVPAKDGFALIGYQAQPARPAKNAGVLVMHENRGLTEHIKDVIRRVATAGYMGLGIDLCPARAASTSSAATRTPARSRTRRSTR